MNIAFKFLQYGIIAGVSLPFISHSLSALCHILLLAGSLLYFGQNPKSLSWRVLSRSGKSLLALCFICILSLIVQDESVRWKFVLKLKYYLIPLIAMIPVSRHRDEILTPSFFKNLFKFVLLSTSVSALVGIIGVNSSIKLPQWIHLRCWGRNRSCGMMGIATSYGYALGLILPPAIVLFMENLKERGRFLYLGPLGVNFLGILFSYCRGAWLGLFAALVYYLKTKGRKVFLMSITGILLLGALVFVIDPSIKKMLQGSRTKSNYQRLSLYQMGWYAFTEKPLLGQGFWQMEFRGKEIKKRHNLAYPNFARQAHNNFIEFLGNTGILGLIAFFLFNLFWFLEIQNLEGKKRRVFMAFFLSYLISGMFQGTFTDGENLFIIMSLYILSQALKTTPEKKLL